MLKVHRPSVYSFLFDGGDPNGLLAGGDAFAKFSCEVCRIIGVEVRTGVNHFQEVELPFLQKGLVGIAPPVSQLHCGRFRQRSPGPIVGPAD